MAEEKIYTQEQIDNNPIPGEVEEANFVSSQSTSGGVIGSNNIKNHDLPYKRVAVELLGQALNTRSRKILAEFEFTEMGALQIGKYVSGVSGDLRISPNGITARNLSGLTTFSIDGTTGDAVFKGTIQAGTFIAGEVVVGDNRVILDGDNARMLVYDDDGIPRVVIGYLKDGF